MKKIGIVLLVVVFVTAIIIGIFTLVTHQGTINNSTNLTNSKLAGKCSKLPNGSCADTVSGVDSVLQMADLATTTGTLPNTLSNSQVAIIGKYVYLFGGSIVDNGIYSNAIYRAPISNPTKWVNTGATLPSVLGNSQVAIIGKYVYLFGGIISVKYTNAITSSATNAIYRAPVSNPTKWINTGATLPSVLGNSQVAIIGKYVYLFGGTTGISYATANDTNIIYRAPVLNPTKWVNTGATLPSVLGNSQVAIIGKYVYLFGGDYSNVIYRAPVSNPTKWVNTGATLPPTSLSNSQVAIIGKYVYLFGGYPNVIPTNAIYRAPVSSPTKWVDTGATLPSVLGNSQVAIIGKYVYLFGGYTGNFYDIAGVTPITNAIYRIPISTNALSNSSKN